MNNIRRTFDQLQVQRLGKYIYALRDPRDRKIFYVGQGTGSRVFEHFNEADNVTTNRWNVQNISSKVLRILDIWRNDEDVEWIIIAHNLPQTNDTANYVESAIFDCLSESQNGETYGSSPPKSSLLSPEDVMALAAENINPDFAINNIFIFPIQNAVKSGTSFYDATRSAWRVNLVNRSLRPSFAIGLKNSISVASFEISKWITNSDELNKYEFYSPNHPNPEDFTPLLNKNWTKILEKAKGFWQRGNYLIVEFNDRRQFRIKRGSQDANTWHNCV